MIDVRTIEASTLDPSFKGYPHRAPPCAVADIGRRGWNVMRGDLPFPVAVLKEAALRVMSFPAPAQTGLGQMPRLVMSPAARRHPPLDQARHKAASLAVNARAPVAQREPAAVAEVLKLCSRWNTSGVE